MEQPVLIKSDAYPGISYTMKFKNESIKLGTKFHISSQRSAKTLKLDRIMKFS